MQETQPQPSTATNTPARPALTNRQPSQQQTGLSFREYWYVYLLIGSFVILFIAHLIRTLIPVELAPIQENSWGEITPGHSKISQVVTKLGEPIATQQTSQGDEYHFTSFSELTPNKVVTDSSGNVKFMKEFFISDFDHLLSDYTDKYGEPDLSLVDLDSSGAVRAHVFLEEGLVVVAHNIDKNVSQRWYFEPTTEQIFLNSWGNNLSNYHHGPDKLDI
jgi:hypothetical protein